MSEWMADPTNRSQTQEFATTVVDSLKKCLPFFGRSSSSSSVRRGKMWAAYHQLRISKAYTQLWKNILISAGSNFSAIFVQNVGDTIFKELIYFPVSLPATLVKEVSMNFYEANALIYAAGYIPRALAKKLKTSAHPLKDELSLCLLDFLADGEDEDVDFHEWILSVDRGGLKHINNTCFQLFEAMELEIRRHISPHTAPPNFIDITKPHILNNDDVQFYWSIVGADWEQDESDALLHMVVDLWLTVRGFSYASAWVEKFKFEHKKSVQKSKGVRKQLLPAPAPTDK